MRACPACNSRYGDDVTFCHKDGTRVVAETVPEKPSAAGAIGQVVADRYRLVKKLGEGGMGEVYVAEHIHIEKRVALKLLRAEALTNTEAVTRFRQEARSASSIGHENIIEIDDFGTLPDGRVYLTMEYLEGEPLDELVEQTIPAQRMLDIMVQIARGLAAAHAKGIIHRDMKPENVFVQHKDGRDVAKILDFGIAKVSGADLQGQQRLTQAGAIFGTPIYMSPEQALGTPQDQRSDIYSLGIMLYEAFTGAVPFKADSFMAILTQHVTSDPVAPSVTAAQNGRPFPSEIEPIILRAIRKKPEERFQSMNELAAALTEAYRRRFGAGITGSMAPPPISQSQFVPIPSGHVAVPRIPGLAYGQQQPATLVAGAPQSAQMKTVVGGQPQPAQVQTVVGGQPQPAQLKTMVAGQPQPASPATLVASNTGAVITPPPMPTATPATDPAAAAVVNADRPPTGAFLTPGEQPVKKSNGLLIALIVLGVLAVAAGVIVWFFAFGPGKPKRAAEVAEVTPSEGDGGPVAATSADAAPRIAASGPDAGQIAAGGAPDAARLTSEPPDAGTIASIMAPDAAPLVAAEVPDAAPVAAEVPDAAPIAEVFEEPDAAPRPTKVDVPIDSDPSGAQILINRKVRGRTPGVLPLLPEEEVQVTLKLKGYHEKTVMVSGTDRQVKVTLKKKKERPPKDDPCKKVPRPDWCDLE